MTLQIPRKQFTVAQYYQMIDVGILTEGDHVELLQGEIIHMSPIGRQHAACVDRLTELFVQEIGQSRGQLLSLQIFKDIQFTVEQLLS